MNEMTNMESQDLTAFFGGNGLTGFEDIDESDLSIAKIKLLQMQSDEAISKDIEATPGQFFNVQTGEAMDEVNCYFLSVSKSRACFERPYKKGSTAKCSSIDGKTGTTQNGNHKSCEKCKYADWNLARQEGKDKPDCTQSYVWLGAMIEDDVPFRLTIGGASFKTSRKLISQLAMKGAALFTYGIKITSNLVNSPKGAYYEPVFTITEAFTNKDIVNMAPEKQRELLDTFSKRQELLQSLKDVFENARRQDILEVDDSDIAEVVEDDEYGEAF